MYLFHFQAFLHSKAFGIEECEKLAKKYVIHNLQIFSNFLIFHPQLTPERKIIIHCSPVAVSNLHKVLISDQIFLILLENCCLFF